MARGGSRSNAGRKAGGQNKATIERAALAERILAEQAGKPGKKLGREVLQDFVEMFSGLAAAFQPVAPVAGAPLTSADMEKWAKGHQEPIFAKYATLAVQTAGQLASYQSPKLKAVMVTQETPPGGAQVAQGGADGTASTLTPREAYRLLRDSDVIDIAPARAKKAAGNG